MKTTLVGTLAIVLALLGVPRLLDALGGPDWKTYVSESGGYAVEMPGEVKHQNQTVKEGPIQMVIYMAAVELPDGAFMTCYNDYPVDLSGVHPDEILHGARDGWLAGIGATLVSEEAIELDGRPGMEVVAKGQIPGKGAAVMYARMYLGDDRMYQMNFVGAVDKTSEEVIRHFLDSFRFTR